MFIVNRSSPGDGTIVIDGESKTVRLGRNVFYLAVGTSHQIQAGTNKIGYRAPECGENTINAPWILYRKSSLRKPQYGPFPVLIGVAGGDGMYAFRSELPTSLLKKGIMTVDFAPQGRGESEGDDNHHGFVHQDDLKAIVDFVNELSFVQRDNIGILSYSYGVVLATGALARYPDMPVAFLIDWEGPSCPGKDLQRGLENDEAWAYETIRFLNNGRETTPEELSHFLLHGGSIFDEAYWEERDASRFAADISCPYLRVQFDQDHVQGSYKTHMIAISNAATMNSGHWTRCNDNPPNIIYSEEELSQYHFHHYSGNDISGLFSSNSQSVDTILLGYAEEMFFSRPYESQ